MNLLNLGPNERMVAMAATKDFPEDRFLVFATRNGLIKKTALSAYSNVRSGGIIAINIEDGDELLSVRITGGDDQIFIGTRQGMGIRFSEKDVRPMGRDTTGVIGVVLRKDNDVVVEMDVVDEKAHLLSVTENGYGKRSEVTEYRYQGRGGSGVINVKVTEKNGAVVGIKSVTDADQLLLITERGQLIRIKVKDIRETGRAAQGVRVIQLEEGDRVVGVAKLAEPDDAEEEAQASLPVPEPAAAPGQGPRQEARGALPRRGCGRRRRGRRRGRRGIDAGRAGYRIRPSCDFFSTAPTSKRRGGSRISGFWTAPGCRWPGRKRREWTTARRSGTWPR